MAAPDVVWKGGRFGRTSRRDAWWLSPTVVFLGFTAFIVYSTWAAFQNNYYTFGPYISPFYSPELFGSSRFALFGPKPSWYPNFLPFSPAFFILWIPGLFRLTCYYYRGAYYKSFWADPPSCAVGEPRKKYLGERSFPLILQNFHRNFLRLSYIVWAFLVYDAIVAFQFRRRISVSASEPLFLSSTSSSSLDTSSAATPFATSPEAGSTPSPNIPSVTNSTTA